MDKCREAFERFECEKYEANYDDMKKNWDWYESQFGYRYSPDSLRGKDWAVWQKAWQHQQAKVEELNQELHLVLNNWNDLTKAIHARTNGTAVAEARQLYEKVDELQKRVDALEKAEFKLAQVKAILQNNPKLLESILVKKIE